MQMSHRKLPNLQCIFTFFLCFGFSCLADDGTQDRGSHSDKSTPDWSKRSLEEVRQAADAGVWQAQYELGARYFFGQGLETNAVEADKSWQKAAEQQRLGEQWQSTRERSAIVNSRTVTGLPTKLTIGK